MKVIILGAGLVGVPMALDLAKDQEFEVSIADINADALQKASRNPRVTTIQKDLSYPDEVSDIVAPYDYVINAVPGFMGFNTLETIIKSGKNVVDIAFSPEDPFLLDDLAKTHQVTAIVDCGVAPGMSNLLSGYADSILDQTETILIYVGGLPTVREWPFEYRAVFSPFDVIEEYTRPARYVERGELITKPALTDREYHNFPHIGTLESFNSDGLRTLAHTMKVPNMKEKTLRYPGHVEKMELFRETGFFSQEAIDIQGTKIKPLELTAKLLFPKWKLKDGECDLTILQIIVEGLKDSRKTRYTYNLLDRYDARTQTHSMARTTGYTATTAIRFLSRMNFHQHGIIPPEFLGKNHDYTRFFLKELEMRGINYRETIHTF